MKRTGLLTQLPTSSPELVIAASHVPASHLQQEGRRAVLKFPLGNYSASAMLGVVEMLEDVCDFLRTQRVRIIAERGVNNEMTNHLWSHFNNRSTTVTVNWFRGTNHGLPVEAFLTCPDARFRRSMETHIKQHVTKPGSRFCPVDLSLPGAGASCCVGDRAQFLREAWGHIMALKPHGVNIFHHSDCRRRDVSPEEAVRACLEHLDSDKLPVVRYRLLDEVGRSSSLREISLLAA